MANDKLEFTADKTQNLQLAVVPTDAKGTPTKQKAATVYVGADANGLVVTPDDFSSASPDITGSATIDGIEQDFVLHGVDTAVANVGLSGNLVAKG